MKRRITELEEKLLKDNWQLVLKRYGGKRSEKTKSYEYHKDLQGFCHIIVLDKTRENIIKYGIGEIFIKYLTEEEHLKLRKLFLDLKVYVETLKCETIKVEEPLDLESVE